MARTKKYRKGTRTFRKQIQTQVGRRFNVPGGLGKPLYMTGKYTIVPFPIEVLLKECDTLSLRKIKKKIGRLKQWAREKHATDCEHCMIKINRKKEIEMYINGQCDGSADKLYISHHKVHWSRKRVLYVHSRLLLVKVLSEMDSIESNWPHHVELRPSSIDSFRSDVFCEIRSLFDKPLLDNDCFDLYEFTVEDYDTL